MRHLIIILAIISIPFSAHANNEIYNSCKDKLSGKLSAGEVRNICQCTQDSLGDKKSKHISKRKTENTVSKCMTSIITKGAKNLFYKGCMNNPKMAGSVAYKNYCGCSANLYSNEMTKNGIDLNSSKSDMEALHEKAIKKAVSICLAKHKPK